MVFKNFNFSFGLIDCDKLMYYSNAEAALYTCLGFVAGVVFGLIWAILRCLFCKNGNMNAPDAEKCLLDEPCSDPFGPEGPPMSYYYNLVKDLGFDMPYTVEEFANDHERIMAEMYDQL